MRIGYSVVDITPDLGVELSGYGWYLGRKAEGIIDNLYARGVAFDDNSFKMLIINCDLIAIDELVNIYEVDKEKNPGIFKAVKIWAQVMKDKLHKEEDPYIEKAKIQVFRIGDALIIGFPGEIFTLIGTIIRNEIPSMNIIAVGNANSTMRYVPTKDDIENKGYAALTSCFLYQRLPLKPGEGERMAEVVAREIKQRLK